MRLTALVSLLVTSATPLVLSADQINGYSFTIIEGPGGVTLGPPLGINDRGQIVGFYSADLPNTVNRGFLLDDGGFTPIDAPFPGVYDTVATGINNLGQIVGHYADPSGRHGFILEEGTFTKIPYSIPMSINDRGQIVGTYFDGTSPGHGFLYEGGTSTPIGIPFANPTSINNREQIVGYYDSAGQARGFVYEAGVFTSFHFVGLGTYLWDINDRGQIAGESFYLLDSFILDRGAPSRFAVPFADAVPGSTVIYGINNRGQIIGWYYDRRFGNRAFVATPQTVPISGGH